MFALDPLFLLSALHVIYVHPYLEWRFQVANSHFQMGPESPILGRLGVSCAGTPEKALGVNTVVNLVNFDGQSSYESSSYHKFAIFYSRVE